MEGTKYTEVSIDAARKGEEDNFIASRPVKRIVERQGLQGNEILAYSFVGF